MLNRFVAAAVEVGVAGDPARRLRPRHEAHRQHEVRPAGAKALLDKFGYVDRDKDGWRDLPDGKPLVLKKGTVPSALERQYDELWKRNMTAVGIRIDFVTQKGPDLVKMARGGQLQMWQLGNRSTTTEGYGFLGIRGSKATSSTCSTSIHGNTWTST